MRYAYQTIDRTCVRTTGDHIRANGFGAEYLGLRSKRLWTDKDGAMS